MEGKKTTIYIPVELCDVLEGQPKIGKRSLSRTLTETSPKERFGNVISKIDKNACGIIRDLTFLKEGGRIIAAPQLEYGGEDKSHIARLDKDGWCTEESRKIYKVTHVQNWVVISFANPSYCGDKELNKYCKYLIESANTCGMTMKWPNFIKAYDTKISTEKAILEAKRSGAEFAIVVLNHRGKNRAYAEVKFLSDFVHNLVTQCMQDKTLISINNRITTNVCLKINVKLDGINHILFRRPKYFIEPVIVIGVDAIHWPRYSG